MFGSKKINFIIFLFILILLIYFAFNPYSIKKYQCTHEKLKSTKELVLAIYLPKQYEISFKGRIYTSERCKKNDDVIFCSADFDGQESISFQLSMLGLEHYWERYDSGEFVFDKTQIIKTKIQDFYTCSN